MVEIQFGNGGITATSRDFVDGYQAGHLAYVAEERITAPTDEQITALFLEKLEDMGHSSLYGVGYAIGWLNTLARRGGQS